MPTLFDTLPLGRIELRNRVAMAPMTRSRANTEGVPAEYTADYYGQRAGSGLIITEGTQPSAEGQGYARTPGIHTDAQVAAWSRVCEAVHDEGGHIFVQIMHAGRVAHPLNRLTDAEPVAPSAIAPETTQMWTDQEQMVPIGTPRALETSEIQHVIDEYVYSAKRAIDAGMDGVELHAASGYLPNQFMCSNTNQRTDRYGGAIKNRIRFTLELLEALAGTIGSDRVGVKFSPAMGFNDCLDENPEALYTALMPEVGRLGLAYAHVSRNTDDWDVHATLRPLYDGVYMAGGGLRSRTDGQQLLDDGHADGTVWGWCFVANPDLVRRLETDGPYAEPDPTTFYTPGEAGYTDYPPLG